MSLTTLFLFAATAAATDVDTFEPSSSQAYGTGTLQGESPQIQGDGPAGGLFMNYAMDPVVRSFSDGTRADAVSSMLPISLWGGYTLSNRTRLDLFVPVYASVNAPINDYNGAALGDIRGQAVVPVYDAGDAFALAVVPQIGLPTGSADALTQNGFHAGVTASAGGMVPDQPIGWVANLGFTAAPTYDLEGIGMGSHLDLLGGGWWQANSDLRVGTEVDLQAGLAKGDKRSNTLSTAHLFAQQFLPNGAGFTLGAGTALISGVGAPSFRLFAGVPYAKKASDMDRDGLADEDDRCVDSAEDVDGFEDDDGCPDPDNDGDGVLDADDACMNEAEDADGFEDEDGCPDADPEPAEACVGEDCPDDDEDGVPNDRDKCPDEPKPEGEAADTSDGCPKLAYLVDDRIAIAQPITFTDGTDALEAASTPVLDAVAEVLAANPQLERIEVQGHSDNNGDEASTEAQAKAVIHALVSSGVAAERLVAKGYGASVPLDTNRTEQGRAKNRRIEFVQEDARTVTRDGDDAESGGDSSDDGDSGKTVTKPEGGNVVDPGGAEAPRDPSDPWADVDADPSTPSSPFGDVEGVNEVGTEASTPTE